MNIEEKTLYNKVTVGFGILIILLVVCLLSVSYEKGVKKCIESGHNETFCRKELSK